MLTLCAEWKCKIDGICGMFHAKVNKDTNCLVVGGSLNYEAEMRKARKDYLIGCLARKKRLPFDMYKVEMIGEASSMVTIKVKGHSAVHEASGLQDSGHILEEGGGAIETPTNNADAIETPTNNATARTFSLYRASCPPVIITLHGSPLDPL
ncbi:hypothetical protein JHK87_055294 [Glycine soja]|nr:hypothetical protein JHK87_055294 [Glycine soja]